MTGRHLSALPADRGRGATRSASGEGREPEHLTMHFRAWLKAQEFIGVTYKVEDYPYPKPIVEHANIAPWWGSSMPDANRRSR